MVKTNYLGVLFVADSATPSQQLVVNPDGSINVVASGSSTPTTYTSAGTGEYGLAVAGTDVALTPPVGAIAAQITISGCDMRYRDDGVSPTAAVGMPVFNGASWFYSGPLSALRFIAQSGSGTLNVSYYA